MTTKIPASLRWKKAGKDLGSYYPIRPECQDEVPKVRFKPRAGKTLSARRWQAVFSPDGHLDIAKVLRRIQRGGVHPTVKGAVWEFLLGCYDPNSTFQERDELRQSRREKYEVWKAECHTMVPVIGSGKFLTDPCITEDGEPIGPAATNINGTVTCKKVLQWMLSLHQIGLDVVRTDQTLTFYELESNRAKLWDILSIYAWVDNDIGYVQGMNDICSPVVILIENEADAFWCFEHAMRRMRDNFKTTSNSMGVQAQLSTLSYVVKTIDPKLHQHFETLDGGEYLFAFRMLMVLFRREFSFVDSMYLWELMWAMEYNPNIFATYEHVGAVGNSGGPKSKLNNKLLKKYGKFERNNVTTGRQDQQGDFAIFLVASVLETKNKKFLKEAKDVDDIVTIMNDVTKKMDAKKAVNDALKLHKKYLEKTNNTSKR